MVAGITGNLIAAVLIKLGQRFSSIVFREEDIRDWVDSPDFREFSEEKIQSETPPEPAPDPAAFDEFFSSEAVSLIVEQVFEQNDQTLSKLEGEFVVAFEDFTPASENLDPKFAHWLFRTLVSASEAFLSTKTKKGDKTAEEYLHVLRHKKEMEGQKRIEKKVDGVQNSITELQQTIKRPAGGQNEKFIRWQDYFHRVEGHLLPLGAGSRLKPIVYSLNKAEEFLGANRTKILVLHAPGGSGKSHLLHQIAHDLEEKHSNYTILSVTPGLSDLESALSQELDGDRRYLLLYDDADRRQENLALLFTYVKYQSSNVKIILTARTAGLRGLQTVLNERLCQDVAEVVKIGDWSRDDLKELLRFVLGDRHHNQEDLIVSTFANPYLITWAGNSINKNPGITVERLRRKFADDLEFETTCSLVPEFDKRRVNEFLADLALIGPFKRGDRAVLSLLMEGYGLTEDAIQTQIDQMVESGVLRDVGYSIRFNPDMKGDLYLAHHINSLRNSGALREWIESWGPNFNDSILTSLEAASRFCEEDIIKDYFTSWVHEATLESKDLPGYYRTKRLEALSRFCYLVPEESIDLIYAYIDTPPPGDGDNTILSPNRDTYGAVILPLIRTGSHREAIFDLIEHIHENALDGRYANNTMESMIAEAISPFYNTLERMREMLTLLENRLDAGNEFSVITLGKALSEALRADHEMSYLSAPNRITWSLQSLPVTPAVLETREHAISILKRMLYHQSVCVRRKGIEACGGVGSKFGDKIYPLSEKIAEERRIIIAEFKRLIQHETDYGVLSDIESLFFRWWQYKVPGTEEAEAILKAFPRPMEYILYGTLFYSRPLLLSFDPETIPSGKEERNKWCLNAKSGFAINTDKFVKFSEPIVNHLSTKYSDTDSVAILFRELQAYQEHANLSDQHSESLLSFWIAKDPDIFFELHNREQFWDNLSVELKNAVDFGLCTHDPKRLEFFASEILAAPQNVDFRRIKHFIRVMTRHPPDEAKVRDWLTRLIGTGKKEIHLTLLYNLWVLSPRLEDYAICVTSYLDILSRYETMDGELLEFVTYALRDLIENEDRIDGHQKGAIKKCFKEKLISTPSFGSYPEHEIQTLINYVLTDTEEILEFISQKAEKKRNTRNYQVLPLDGVSFLENVGDCTELDPILDELFALMNEGLIYREQLSVQLKAIMSLKHPASGKLCLEEYAERLLNEERVDDALALCPVFLSHPGTEETVLKILGDGVATGKRKDIKRLFREYVWHDGISILGGHSPDLEQKRKVISCLLDLAPRGILRAVLREVLQRFDAGIQIIKKGYDEEDCVIR